MKLDFQGQRVLAVTAHPDDAELLCAGTLARAKEDGAAIGLCVLCRGDKGQSSRSITDLAAVRRRETIASTGLLGAELSWGGFPDGDLFDGREQRRKLRDIFHRFRPTLVLAHAPEDYHPDHRAASALAEAASWFCASRGQKSHWPALEAAPALWWMDTINMSAFAPGFYVDVSRHFELKVQMLGCHKSQLRRSGDADFSPLVELMRRQAQARGSQAGVTAAEAFRAYHAYKRARAW